jgi:hypothetical protein
MNAAVGEQDPVKVARLLGAVWAVGHSCKRVEALVQGAERRARDFNDEALMMEFAHGCEWGTRRAIEVLKARGYTVKDFDKRGWLPDDPEQRPARLAELGL